MGTLFLEYFYHDVVIKDILYDLNGSEGANSIIFTLNNNEECDEDTDDKLSNHPFTISTLPSETIFTVPSFV